MQRKRKDNNVEELEIHILQSLLILITVKLIFKDFQSLLGILYSRVFSFVCMIPFLLFDTAWPKVIALSGTKNIAQI